MMKLTRRYEVQAAHRLSAGVPKDHPCRRPHGHRYLIEVDVVLAKGEGLIDGMLLEYAEIDAKVWDGCLALVDHHDLNTLAKRAKGFGAARAWAVAVSKNSTVENFSFWLYEALRIAFAPRALVTAVRIEEDSRSAVEVNDR